jgi:hypothetical protein
VYRDDPSLAQPRVEIAELLGSECRGVAWPTHPQSIAAFMISTQSRRESSACVREPNTAARRVGGDRKTIRHEQYAMMD